MKKVGILNRDISEVVASLGHKDMLAIADAGLPIPQQTRRIDLALAEGIPPFLDAVRVVLLEMEVEEAIVAQEIKSVSPQVFEELTHLLGDVPIRVVPHEALKEYTRTAKAVVRTGEFTPYANVILVSGVVF